MILNSKIIYVIKNVRISKVFAVFSYCPKPFIRKTILSQPLFFYNPTKIKRISSLSLFSIAGKINLVKCYRPLPGELTLLFPALMTWRVHLPSAFSPQKCTLKNGQSSKLDPTTSLGRSKSSVEVVPIGDVSSKRRLPRGKNRSDTLMRITKIVKRNYEKIVKRN